MRSLFLTILALTVLAMTGGNSDAFNLRTGVHGHVRVGGGFGFHNRAHFSHFAFQRQSFGYANNFAFGYQAPALAFAPTYAPAVVASPYVQTQIVQTQLQFVPQVYTPPASFQFGIGAGTSCGSSRAFGQNFGTFGNCGR